MARPEPTGTEIAIVGMGALFPGSADLDEFWRHLAAGDDAITDVPADRWDPLFFDPAGRGPDRFYCRRGGFLGDLATFDPSPFGIMPNAVDGVEPDQLLALRVAKAALDDAGGDGAVTAPERTGVIVGRGGYLTPGVARLEQRVRTAQQLVESVRSLLPDLDEARLAEVKAAFTRQLGPDRPESAIDLVPNLTASRIANRLDLRGPAYTVDGACASSLLAVDAGVRELRSGRCDLVVAGGVHLCHDLTLWSVFTQLGALSPTEQIRPFHRSADGLLIGEGVGMLVLKRREDAERDGDRIYAVVAGVGVSSDGREVSLMKPSTEGQLLALERAWAEAGLDPATCGLVEAHGTATAAGDAAELATLARFFGDGEGAPGTTPEGGAAVVGSVKSMIGHAMPAAGAAGLIKAALAVHHGVAPPTLHCDDPAEALAATRFRTTGTALPWEAAPAVRVAAVNAFGFGGINTHAVLRAHPDSARTGRTGGRAGVATVSAAATPATAADAPADDAAPVGEGRPGGRVLLLAARDTESLLAQLDAVADDPDRDDRCSAPGPADGPLRLAIVDPKPARLDLARRVVSGNKPWRGRNDVWFAPRGLLDDGGKLAFVFPGVEPGQHLDVADVAAHFGWSLPEQLGESDLEQQSRDIITVGRTLHAAMDRLGVRPDVIAGHSLGEWSGLIAAGMVPDETVDELTGGLLPSRLTVPDVGYLMVGAGVATAAAAVEDLDGVDVSHDNCVHQSMLCGDAAGLAEAARRLRADGVLCQELAVRSGFHSPSFAGYVGPFREACDAIAFRPGPVPLWSATDVAPYPEDAEAVRELSVRHLVEPVRFRELALALHDRAGARVFVQLGFGSVAAFLDDTLHDRVVATLAAGSAKRSALAQLLRVAAGLWVEGAAVDFAALADPTQPAGAARTAPEAGTGTRAAGTPLHLGVPLVRLGPDAPVLSAPPQDLPVLVGTSGLLDGGLDGGLVDAGAFGELAASPVVAAYQQVMVETLEAGRQVMAAWAAASVAAPPATGPAAVPVSEPGLVAPSPAPVADGSSSRPTTVVSRRVFSVADDPYLLDHCFYRQPDGWPSDEDRFPVVPMTMLLEVMADAARELVPHRPVVGFDDVRALRWLAVAPPVEATVRATLVEDEGPAGGGDGPVRVRVAIDGYAGATVLLDHGYPAAPDADPTPLDGGQAPPFTAEEMYAGRWMFHGPAYQGVTSLDEFYEDGVRGELADLPAPGALLDCAGQLMGLWAMLRTEVDRLALPTSIRRIRFFGPRPGPDVAVPCTVRIAEHSDTLVRASLELTVDDGVWARIDDWVDRRFESDEVVWPVLVFPEHNTLAEEWAVPGSDVRVQLVRERWTNSASRDLMMRRYLGEAEREEYGRHHPRGQRTHLLGRMAAKDAVRRWWWDRDGGPLHPVEVQVANDAEGRPLVTPPFDPRLSVSIAHTEWMAVAAVSAEPGVGVDIERVAPRDDTFVDVALTPDEVALRPDRWTRDEWVTRAWTAKEAVAKARGTGLAGRPRDYVVEQVDDDLLTVRDPDGAGWRVATRLADEEVVVAVTVDRPPADTDRPQPDLQPRRPATKEEDDER